MSQASYPQSASAKPASGARRRRRSRKRTSLFDKVAAVVWPAERSVPAKLGIWLAVLLLFVMSIQGGRLGLAHLDVLRVENQLRYWQKLGRVASPASVEAALVAIARANRLHASNPYQLTLQANVLEWRAYSPVANGGQVVEADYRTALALHKQAAELRPLWPDTWAEMAQAKVRLNEFDAELEQILTRADQLGPYTPAVHLAVIQAGLPHWSGLSGAQRERFDRHVARGLADHRVRKHVTDMFRFYGLEQKLPVKK
uniref:VpsP family polysaccharide biosynthesis protein n=1 Tax=Microbulbifer agarilyticus TaxID=260552 RepID=UPI0002557B38|nr:VpsP family polysaccharide biosynthesis protein [Microbulbifer agarilyticus]